MTNIAISLITYVNHLSDPAINIAGRGVYVYISAILPPYKMAVSIIYGPHPCRHTVIDRGEFEAMKTLSGRRASSCDKHQPLQISGTVIRCQNIPNILRHILGCP